jgi:hypothetical protein
MEALEGVVVLPQGSRRGGGRGRRDDEAMRPRARRAAGGPTRGRGARLAARSRARCGRRKEWRYKKGRVRKNKIEEVVGIEELFRVI